MCFPRPLDSEIEKTSDSMGYVQHRPNSSREAASASYRLGCWSSIAVGDLVLPYEIRLFARASHCRVLWPL